ncbi:MAG: hypothetical protein V3S55_05440 [Nitrospiraceae bacterium]
MRMFQRRLCPVSLLFTVLLLVGTSSSAAEEKEAARGITREELRAEIMRFASQSAERVADAYFKLEEHFQTPKARRAALENDVAYVSSSLDIAIGPDPEINMLDMVVMVTLTRIIVEEYGVPKVFGDEAKILVEVFRREEADIWSIAGKVLTPQQQKELRDLIRLWRKRNPDQVFVEAARFGDFAAIVGESELAKAQQGGGFLGIKGVTREVSETRMLAERAMFYAQRVPWIMRSMVRLMLLDVAQTPEIKQVMTDTGTLAKAMHQTAKMTEELPELITEQRDQIMKQVTAERKAAIEQVMEGVATQRTATFNELTEWMIGQQEGKTPLVSVVVDRVGNEGQQIITYAFHRAVLLILIFFLAMLAYRFASVRLIGSGQARGA